MTDDRCCPTLFADPLGEDDAVELAALLKVLADPVRLRLVSIVAAAGGGEVCACDLPAALDRSQPTVSHHLSQLVKAGILEREQRGRWAWFRLCDERLRAVSVAIAAPTAPESRPSVLFLCVHNAGRSQMAAGFLRHLVGDTVDVYSGGSDPGTQVDAAAVEAMNEVGIDISGQQPMAWTDEVVRAADVVVSMGCGDACPILPGKRYEDWELADPAGQSVDFVRVVRDHIRSRVEALIDSLDVSSPTRTAHTGLDS